MSSELKPYAEYKDSGVEWLGEVPGHWRLSRHKYEAVLIMGQSPDSNTCSEDTDGTPFLQGNAEFGDLYPSHRYRCEESPRVAPARALLISVRAPVGAINLTDQPYGIGRGLCAAIPIKDRLALGYARHLVFITRSELWRVATGSTYEAVSIDEVSNMIVVVPPLSEQRAIADYLDAETGRIDTLISEQRELIELLKEKRQALISHCVTRGLDPDVPMRDSGVEWLGEVPEHWEVKRLKYAISFVEGPGILAKDFREEGVPLIRISGAQSRFVGLDGCNYLDPEDVESRWSHFQLEVGDLLISASASTGTVAEVDTRTAGAIPYTGLIRLRPQESQTVKDFVRYVVSSGVFYVQIRHHQTGSTIQHFGPTHLARMVIPVPPLPEQHAIADYLDTETARIDALITEAEETITLMQEHRSALISACVTGKVRVPGVADPAAEEQTA